MSDTTLASPPADRPAASRAALSTPYRVGIVGAGGIAEYHLAILRELPDVEVVGVCDPHPGRRDALADQWDLPHRAATLEQLVQQARPDVVHVLAPPPLHFCVTKEALQLGVHVLAEKPLTLRADEARELIQLAAAEGLHLGVNHNWVHVPLFRRLLDDVAARRIGRVEQVVSVNNLPLAQLDAGQHDHWMFQEPGNVLFEQGPHPLSQICELLGAVQEIQTQCSGRRRLREGNPFFSTWQHTLRCERGTAYLSLSFGGSFPDAQLHVIGQDGALHLDQLNNLYTIDRRTKYLEPLDRYLRGRGRARQVAAGARRSLADYCLSLLRLKGRQDAYYLGMKGSIADFYQRLTDDPASANAATSGLQTIAALEQAVRQMPRLEFAADRLGSPAPGLNRRQPSRTEKILVLGGTGFIGRKLVAALAEAGYPVRLLARSRGRVADLAARYELEILPGDIRDAEQVDRAVAGAATVMHLVAGAPPNWAGFEELYLQGTRHVAAACLKHGVQRLYFASSIAALYLGDPRQTVTEQTPIESQPHRRCDYAKAKVLCERMLMDLFRQQGLPVTIFRPGIVVGEGGPVQHLGVGEWPGPTQCVSWGTATRRGLPFVLVDDVAAALVQALERPGLEGQAFNLVGDVRLSAEEYIAILREELQRDFQLHRQSVWRWTAIEFAKWGIKLIARKPENQRMTYREAAYRTAAAQFDCSGTQAALGWQPVADREEFIERGIRQAIA